MDEFAYFGIGFVTFALGIRALAAAGTDLVDSVLRWKCGR